MEHWSQSEEWKAQGWQSTARAASESRPEVRRRVWTGAALAAARKFIEVPSALSASSTGRGRPEQQGKEAHDYEHSVTGSAWSSWDTWSASRDWPDWTWSWSSWHEDPGRTWENPTDWRQNQGEQGSTSEWTDWRGRGDDLNRWHSDRRYEERAAPEEPPGRTFEASDPFIDLSLTSISQLLREQHADSRENLEQAMHRLARQLRNPDVRLSHKQLLRCLEVSSGNSEFLAAVIPYVSLSASTLSPTELVEAAQSLAAAPSTALDASGVVLGEAICRHSSFDLDQLSSLSRPASGRALKALLRQAEVDNLPDEAAEDEEVLVACLDRLADKAKELTPEDLVAALSALAVLGVRDDLATAALTEEVTRAIPSLGCPELALLSWAFGTLGLRSVPAMEALADEALRRKWRFRANDLIKLLFGFVAVGLRHRPLLDAVADAMDWSIQQFSLRGLVQAAWFFATLASPQQRTMTSIACEILAQLDRLSASELAGVAWSFATLRLRHGRLMQGIASEAAEKISQLDDEDLARLAWAFAALDLAPRELTRLLVLEASKRDAAEGWQGPEFESECERANSPYFADSKEAEHHRTRQTEMGESPPERGYKGARRRRPSRRQRRAEKAVEVPREAPVEAVEEVPDTPEPGSTTAATSTAQEEQNLGQEVSSETKEDLPSGEDREPEYDALLEMLREQIRAGVEPKREASAVDIDGTNSDLSKADKARILELLEVQRVADQAAGRKRNKSSKKKEKAERKLGREYIRNEISNAFNAQHDPGVRYYNSVAIRVKKGEKAVDTKTLEAVAQGKSEIAVRSKEDRIMARRIA